MSDFLSSAKNMFSSAVSRTGWEAQKQMRVHSKQSEIDKLLEQRQKLMEELGQVAMTLYQQGALSDAQLSRLCASIFELDHDLRTRETQLQEVKNEPYPADQFAPSPTMDYTPPSPSSASAAAGGAGAGTQSGAQGQPRCPQCGNAYRPNSAYCRSCGAKLH